MKAEKYVHNADYGSEFFQIFVVFSWLSAVLPSPCSGVSHPWKWYIPTNALLLLLPSSILLLEIQKPFLSSLVKTSPSHDLHVPQPTRERTCKVLLQVWLSSPGTTPMLTPLLPWASPAERWAVKGLSSSSASMRLPSSSSLCNGAAAIASFRFALMIDQSVIHNEAELSWFAFRD